MLEKIIQMTYKDLEQSFDRQKEKKSKIKSDLRVGQVQRFKLGMIV